MKVQFEDYFGNDIIILDFVDTELDNEILKKINNISGYSIADVDDDVVRLQNIEVNENQLINAIKSISEIIIKNK